MPGVLLIQFKCFDGQNAKINNACLYLLRSVCLLAARHAAKHNLLDCHLSSITLSLGPPHDALAPLAQLLLQIIIPRAHFQRFPELIGLAKNKMTNFFFVG